ncbi:rho-N domain-containing protein 1, chloroplastic-like isoform X2 [Actinidia eriantha]|uniref:rho-N domain-containing protein 1, chloroplastic-like isoform X2 n=1 Tax=Actinidia eriantha TaxID=165200 RepID=UPI002587E439|nr:rho-N domain-containing protein 1, chloroplastic-like isoform X2 [Actinidia eriantha]
MSPAIHFVTQNAPDGSCRPCSGVSGRAVSLSPFSSCGDYKTLSQIKIVPSRGRSFVCKAGPNSYRRNPDFSRQNKQWFSRNRNRQNNERDGSENLEESEELSSKNGASSAPKFQATATPGPREREIVEMFRKVQAQLREGATLKEEKKPEESQGRGNESESVDSLLKLLRKHNTQPGKKSSSSSGSSRSFILDQPEPNGASEETKSTTFLNSNNHVADEAAGGPKFPPFGRPVSNFQRRSPVPQVSKFQPIPSDSVTDTWINGKRDIIHPEPEIDELKLGIEAESSFSDGDVFGGTSEYEDSDIDVVYSDEDVEEEKPIVEDLSAMKLPELRALAKSRGLKGYSKLKKSDIVELLSGGST